MPKANNIFLATILVLTLSIFAVRMYMVKFDNGQNKSDTGKVKSAEINTNITSLPNLPVSNNPPTKKADYYEPYVWADSIIALDEKSFYPLWEKNAHKQVPIASTTKIMTAIVALENYGLNDTIEISEKAALQIGSETQLRTGEKLTVEAILNALLIQSGNDAAYALAEKIGFDNFVRKMNDKAKEIGLKDTEFKDPAGLDEAGHSSAFDLGIMTAYALKLNKFSEIVKTPEKIIYSVDGRIEHKLDNSNRLIKADSPFYLAEAIGVKTGYTPDAGHCMVSAAKFSNHTVISVVLNTAESTNEASAKETKKLLDWVNNSYNL